MDEKHEGPLAVAEAALLSLLDALRGVDEAEIDLPTRSTDFTVAELAGHLVENSRMLAAALGMDAPDLHGEGPEESVAEAVRPLLSRLAGMAPCEELDLGAPVEAETVLKYLSVEFLVHAWDITNATGRGLRASSSLTGAVLENAAAVRDSLFFNPETFSEPVHVPDQADPLSRLLAMTGR